MVTDQLLSNVLPCRTPEIRGLLLLIANSYYKLTGKILIEADFDRLPDAIFNAPFVLLAHDKFQVGSSDWENSCSLRGYRGPTALSLAHGPLNSSLQMHMLSWESQPSANPSAAQPYRTDRFGPLLKGSVKEFELGTAWITAAIEPHKHCLSLSYLHHRLVSQTPGSHMPTATLLSSLRHHGRSSLVS